MQLIVLLGPTASGKSDIAVEVAQYLGVDRTVIVSCDSRQVYRGLDLASGKVDGQWMGGVYMYGGVRHYLIDYVELCQEYSLSQYISDFYALLPVFKVEKIENVLLVGGTGLYAKALVEGYKLNSSVILNSFQNLNTLDLQFEYFSYFQLHPHLPKLNASDFYNPRRLNNWLNRHSSKFSTLSQAHNLQDHFATVYQCAISVEPEILKRNIHTRIAMRIQNGMIEEIESLLITQQVSYTNLLQLGLESRRIAQSVLGWV